MKVLEVNVDDIGMGGVFSLVRSIIKNNRSDLFRFKRRADFQSFSIRWIRDDAPKLTCHDRASGRPHDHHLIHVEVIIFRMLYKELRQSSSAVKNSLSFMASS